jgi:hypothetical protein
LTADNIVYITNFNRQPAKQNIVQEILSSVVSNYNNTLFEYKVDVENPNIAFDIATIQYLLNGMAHRSQGQDHPSQIILNTMRDKMLGV